MEDELSSLLQALGLVPRGVPKPLSGGDIAAVYRLETRQGTVIIKHDDAERLAGEAEGLRALREAVSGLIVPVVIGQRDTWLVMDALEAAPRTAMGDTSLGEGLRELHGAIGDDHGWPRDNACGLTPQANGPLTDGRVFQRERRLLPLAAACRQQGRLDEALGGRIEAIAWSLEDWLPDARPCLVHGDLWSGNVLFTPQGPGIIDPAVYRHYPEVDLAMLTLFGAPGAAFFEAYWNGDAPADWPRREALFQLYPLLNHLLLFGGAYRSGVERTVARLETYRD
ncbi:MAG TPA: fructosamine kinase family protein [Halomonas sp.]|nr:fructosamine kinase family protein [Halomonas sp.]